MIFQILVILLILNELVTKSIVNRKLGAKPVISLLVSNGIYLALVAAFSFLFIEWKVALIASIAIPVLSFAADFVAGIFADKAEKNGNEKQKVLVSFIRVLVLFAVAVLVYALLELYAYPNFIYEEIPDPAVFVFILEYVILALVLTKPASALVKSVLSLAEKKAEEQPAAPAVDENGEQASEVAPEAEKKASATSAAGSLVGILERLLVAVLVSVGSYSFVGYYLIGKTLVKFKHFEDKEYTERYLIGTVTSVLIATFVSLLFRTF